METLLVKIFATALALSQVTTAPESVATRFDRVADQAAVAQLLGAGCTHMRKAFDIEDINLDELIWTIDCALACRRSGQAQAGSAVAMA